MKNTSLIFLLLGLSICIFGIILLIWPDITISTISVMITISLFLSGIITLIFSIKYNDSFFISGLLPGSILDIVLSIVILSSPYSSTMAIINLFSIILSIWAIVKGIKLCVDSIMEKKYIYSKWWYDLIGGILLIIIGISIFITPKIGILAITTLLSILCIFYGIYFIFWAYKVKQFSKNEKIIEMKF